jgi:hypothetical protein
MRRAISTKTKCLSAQNPITDLGEERSI